MKKELSQYSTEAWAAIYLFDKYFGHLNEKDLVWEPTCGEGHMVSAVPAHIPCIGTEFDSVLAEKARSQTGRTIITGDCRSVDLPTGITAVFGNPPFELKVFEQLLDRCAQLLPIGNKAGFLLPAYFMQTSTTIKRLGRRWSIDQKIVPRDLFHRLSKPLAFFDFTRENNPQLYGFLLVNEIADMAVLSRERRELFARTISGPRSLWRESVKVVLTELGGEATLSSIYKAIEGRRPTPNAFWKEKVRQVLQQSFVRTGEATYSIPQAA